MTPVELHSGVAADLAEAADYLDSQQDGLGREFRLAFDEAVDRIVANPRLYAIEIRDLRFCPFRRFSYTIIYADRAACIWISAVAHNRRRSFWRSRRFGE